MLTLSINSHPKFIEIMLRKHTFAPIPKTNAKITSDIAKNPLERHLHPKPTPNLLINPIFPLHIQHNINLTLEIHNRIHCPKSFNIRIVTNNNKLKKHPKKIRISIIKCC